MILTNSGSYGGATTVSGTGWPGLKIDVWVMGTTNIIGQTYAVYNAVTNTVRFEGSAAGTNQPGTTNLDHLSFHWLTTNTVYGRLVSTNYRHAP